MLEKTGMCFFFAQKYHTAMKYVSAIRKELGIRTVFNILGPLTNPRNPTYLQCHPFAVDVSSGVETDGWKDSKKMHAFVKTVKQLNISQ